MFTINTSYTWNPKNGLHELDRITAEVTCDHPGCNATCDDAEVELDDVDIRSITAWDEHGQFWVCGDQQLCPKHAPGDDAEDDEDDDSEDAGEAP